MSFWFNKPIQLRDDYQNILDKKKLIESISKEITDSKIDLDYKIINTQNDTTASEIVDFINKNYETNNFSYKYTTSLFRYFLGEDSLSFAFYPKNKKNMIGFICCVHKELHINTQKCNKIINSIEVNFLCLVPQLRNLHISSHMINILTKESLLYYEDVDCGFYTTSTLLKKPYFSRKFYYFRPLNIDALLDIKLLNDSYNTIVKKKVYNSYSYIKNMFKNKTIEFYNGSEPESDIMYKIYIKLNLNDIKEYQLYDIKYYEDFKKMFSNKDFYIFVLKKNGTVTDFICIYRLDIYSRVNNKECKNGILYYTLYEMDNIEYKKSVLEYIFSYCNTHKLFDAITILEHLGLTEKEYYCMKFIKGRSLYYYMYNRTMDYILSSDNGLITI